MRRLALLLAPVLIGAAPPAETRVDVPFEHGPQQAVVLIREFAVGGSSGWHTHPGVEIAQVLQGVTEMRTAEGTRRYGAGETFVIPRDKAHNGVNVGDVPARMAITYLIDVGAPVRSDAPDPHAGH